MTASPADPPTPPSATLFSDYWWWHFCLSIVCLKFALFGIDPHPQMFMGDSGSYLWTAVSGWIPPDRSFLYGFIIRWVSFPTQSLDSLLVLQVFLGAATAISLAYVCRLLLQLSSRVSYSAGLICAVDPLQLVWERYLMTETISLFLYALMLLVSLSYLRRRNPWQLLLVQILAVLTISFRISYLLTVEATAVALPIIAFMPFLRSGLAAASRWSTLRTLSAHLALSVVAMLALHLGYKQTNGYLAGRPPAYLYSSGLSILATWAPVLHPADSPDPRLARILSQGAEFHLGEARLRNSQLYSDGYLIDRWKETEFDSDRADGIAKQTALHALLHRPTRIFALGLGTFLGYFNPVQIHKQAVSDLGNGEWPKPSAEKLAGRLQLVPPPPQAAGLHTVLQKYFLIARPYYYVVALCPLFCAAFLFFLRETHLFLIFLHASIFLGTNSLLAVTASVRYLQPLSFLTVLLFALIAHHISHRSVPARPSIAL
ncbi:MAG: hypothetical protein H0W43_01295 [Chthoniobacterales bacterium]|nr:hypothetical protein [Chthoniobacterales bacterium]